MGGRSVFMKDENDVVAQNDEDSKAQIMIDTVHAHIHAGDMFQADHVNLALADDGIINILIQIHASQEAHLRLKTKMGGDAEVWFFEGTTFSAAGSGITPRNRSREFTDNALTTVTLAPTITLDGTELSHTVIIGGAGGTAGGGESPFFEEWELKDGLVYLLRVKNISGQARLTGIELDFYEPGRQASA